MRTTDIVNSEQFDCIFCFNRTIVFLVSFAVEGHSQFFDFCGIPASFPNRTFGFFRSNCCKSTRIMLHCFNPHRCQIRRRRNFLSGGINAYKCQSKKKLIRKIKNKAGKSLPVDPPGPIAPIIENVKFTGKCQLQGSRRIGIM